MSQLRELLDLLKRADHHELQCEIETLEAIRDWAQRQACGDLKDGDHVQIKDGYSVALLNSDGSPNGWWRYRECLVPGAGAEAVRIKFSLHHRRWYADIRLDREWSCGTEASDGEPRYWHGPAAETPEGMKEPSKFDQERYPDGRRHAFMFWLEDLDWGQQPHQGAS